eukprot:gene13293-9131_t
MFLRVYQKPSKNNISQKSKAKTNTLNRNSNESDDRLLKLKECANNCTHLGACSTVKFLYASNKYSFGEQKTNLQKVEMKEK